MDLRYYMRFVGRAYAFLLGFFVLLLVVLYFLHREGVQANYTQFVALWGLLVVLTPFAFSQYGGPPDPAQLFPARSRPSAIALTLLFQIVTGLVVVGILLLVLPMLGF